MTIGTAIVAFILGAVVYCAARSVKKDMATGGCSGCGGSCGGGCSCCHIGSAAARKQILEEQAG